MERKIIFTVVLVDINSAENEVTYASLENQSIDRSCIEIVRVSTVEELRNVLINARGTYISILESGVELSPNAYSTALNTIEDQNACIFPIETEERSGHVSAMNTFLKKDRELWDLNISYQFIHSCYYAFLIRYAALSLEQIEGTCMISAIWRLLFHTLVNTGKMPVVEGTLCRIQSTRNLTEFWYQMRDQDVSERFIKGFLRPLYRYLNDSDIVCEKHARYVLMYYLNMFERNFESVNELYYKQVREEITEMMRQTGTPELFIRHLNFSRSRKCFFLKQYGDIVFEDEQLTITCKAILAPEMAPTAIQFITLEEEKIILSGSTKMYGDAVFQIQAELNGRRYPCRLLQRVQRECWFDKTIGIIQYFQADLPLMEQCNYNLRIACLNESEEVVKTVYYFHKFAPLDDKLSFSYRKNNWLLTYSKNQDNSGYIHIEPQHKMSGLKYRLRTFGSVLRNGKSGKKAILVRALYCVLKRREKKVWLISDRVDRGDDNGEVFFAFLANNMPEDVDAYFVLEKKANDYERISNLGKVIEPFSWKHKLYHLLSEYIISSQGNFAVVNPFGRFSRNYKDIMADKKFIFLQHGVTKDDQSPWLNLYNRNIYGLVVSTMPEYDSIFTYDYYYTPERVWLTGMPRYDRLYHDEKKYITIMPTWRKSLAPSRDGRGVWQVTENFEESEYYYFYNNLLNHSSLLKRARQLGYQICFMPHPNTFSVLDRFVKHPEVQFFDLNKSYRKIFAETDLMVTDYSSVAFDFAYLRKPLIYSQFDHDEFFNGSHSYTQGYFDYDRDGFGEVEHSLEATVDRIIEYMENGCTLKEQYRRRIDNTFSFHDQNCCRRVLDKILERRK